MARSSSLHNALLGLLALAPAALALTPEAMISLPRRSPAVPNPSGDWAVFSTSQYSFDEQSAEHSWSLLNLHSGEISPLGFNASIVSELAWVGPTDTSVLYINSTSDTPGGVTLWLSDVLNPNETSFVASLPAAFSGLKAVGTSCGDINFLVNSLAYPNGTAYNSETADVPASNGRLYQNVFVRHWTDWLTKERYALFSGTLKQTDGSYSLSSAGLTNLLSNITFEITRPETPWQPFGDLDDYDISPDGESVVFLSKAPELPKANYTASYIFLVPHDGSLVAQAINGPGLATTPPNAKGASAAPRFSPDSTKVAYLQMSGISYESDRNVVYIADIGSNWTVNSITPLAADWDRSPDLIRYGSDGTTLFLGVADIGTEKIFPLPVDAGADYKPEPITAGGSAGGAVAAFYTLPGGKSVLASASSYYSPRDYYIASTDGANTPLFAANEVDEPLSGGGPQYIDEFWSAGSQGGLIHSWIIKPEGFCANQTYPLVFYVHGGPQGATENAWSNRWNLKTWSDQGYVVVAPNPTGSTSYGQALTDAIQNNWGSYPYEDLVNAWEYVAANLSYVDVERGIEAGASYGGYMTNWIQGHDLGRKFKALVTHDGITSTLNQYTTEELWFPQHDFNGTLVENRDNYERWDPIAHAVNFSTPHFIVHSSLDYRIPESEGLLLFNVLQERGVPSRFLSFPDEGHWVLGQSDSLMWHTEIFNWINYYSGLKESLDDNAVGY